MVFCSLFLSCKISSSLFVAFKAINWSISSWLKRQLSDRGAAISTFEVHVRDIEHLALRALTKALIIKGHKLLEVSVILTYDPLILSLRSMVKIVLLFFSPPSKRGFIELCLYYTLFKKFVNPLPIITPKKSGDRDQYLNAAAHKAKDVKLPVPPLSDVRRGEGSNAIVDEDLRIRPTPRLGSKTGV